MRSVAGMRSCTGTRSLPQLRSILPTLLALVLSGSVGWAQVVRLDTDEFVSGTTMRITYDAAAPGAFFNRSDDLYAAAWVAFYDHEARFAVRMALAGNTFTTDFPVPEGAAYISIEFVSMARTGNDPKNSVSGSVVDRNGRPTPGAMMFGSARGSATPLADAIKELELYPANLAAYRWKWTAMAGADRAAADSAITADLRTLLAPAAPPVDALYAASYGYTMRGAMPDAERMVAALLERFPESGMTAEALRSYEYAMFSKGRYDSIPMELTLLKTRTMAAHPASPLARNNVAPSLSNYRARLRELLPLASIEAICRSWIADAPDDPNPYMTLATARVAFDEELQGAERLLDTAITLYLRNGHRKHLDAFGSAGARQLPEAYRMMAELAERRGDVGKATAGLIAADAVDTKKGARTVLQLAKLWGSLGRPELASRAYAEALQRGAEEARDSLRALHVLRRSNDSGFAEYLARLTGAGAGDSAKAAGTPDPGAGRDAAPSFSATALDGTPLALSTLRGKVLVLNFWFIGCAPCRREMPELNALAEKFRGKDVEFIGMALDDTKALAAFLRKTAFAYRVVPSAAGIIGSFGAAAYPTHVVIDRKGRIVASFTGSADAETDLRPLIERTLRE